MGLICHLHETAYCYHSFVFLEKKKNPDASGRAMWPSANKHLDLLETDASVSRFYFLGEEKI